MRKLLAASIGLAALPAVRAHCPLCVVGAAAAAGGAAYFGMSEIGIGLFIGAFALSMGLWVNRLLPREYVRGQKWLLALLSFVFTVWPMRMVMGAVLPVPVLLVGDYGSLLNRTYVVSEFLLGTVPGALLVCAAPSLSRRITKWRGKQIPFQGVALTLALLVIAAAVIQVVA